MDLHDPNIRSRIEIHEGRRDRIYSDTVGKLTVGIGRNISDKPFHQSEIELMFTNDLHEAWGDLMTHLPWVADLDEVRQYVLLDMSFNLGITRLKQFVRTLGAIEEGDYAQAKRFMLESRWAEQVGRRAQALAKMMGSGQWS